MDIKCKHCGYEWNTSSTLIMISCSSCSRKTPSNRPFKKLDNIQESGTIKSLMENM